MKVDALAKCRRLPLWYAGILFAVLLFFAYIFAFVIVPGISNRTCVGILRDDNNFPSNRHMTGQVYTYLQNPEIIRDPVRTNGSVGTLAIGSNEVIRQTFFLRHDLASVPNLRLELAPTSTARDGDTIHVRVTNFFEDAVYLDKDFSLGDVRDGTALVFSLDSPILYGGGTEQHLYLTAGDLEDRSLALATTVRDQVIGHLNVNAQAESNYDLLVSTVHPHPRGLKVFLALPLLLCWLAIGAALYGCGLSARGGREYSAKRFTCIMLLLGFAYMIVFPLPYTHDEGSHISLAYHLSNRILGVKDTANYHDIWGTIYMRQSDRVLSTEYKPNLKSYENVLEGFTGPLNADLVEVGAFKPTDARVSYVIPAVGIAFGRLIGAGAGVTILLGRALNLLFVAAAMALAIRILPTGRELLMFIAFTPEVLQIAASYSHNAFVYGLAPLYIAVCMYYYFREKKLDVLSLTFILLGGLSLAVIRNGAYAPLAFIFLIIPKERFSDSRSSRWIKRIFILVFLAGAVFVLKQSVKGAWYDSGSAFWSFGEIVKDPFLAVRVGLNTLLEYSVSYPEMGFVTVSNLVSLLLPALAAVTAIPADSDCLVLGKKAMWIVWVVSLLTLLELCAAFVALTPKHILPWMCSRYYVLLFLPVGLLLKGVPFRMTGTASKNMFLCAEIMLSAIVIGSTFAFCLFCW